MFPFWHPPLPSSVMSHLPFTDGSNGNGITCPAMLRKYLAACPLALCDDSFIISYLPLISADPLLKQDLLAAAGNHLWGKKLRGEALVGWERVYEMDPKTNDADLVELADAMGVSLENARKLFRK